MHVVVNAAMSADGKLSSRERTQIEISGPDDFDRVDQLRADSDAIMVGVGTVLADDPSLTLDSEERKQARRDRGDPENPARVVADSRVRTPPDATVLNDAAHTYLLVSQAAPTDFVEQMEEAGATVIATGEDRVNLTTALGKLEGDGVEQLMVEGGGELIFSLVEAELVDELSVFVGPKIIGGRDAPTLADGDGFTEEFPELELRSVERLDGGALLEWDVR
ncbi:2,5-diamino-6-(ribosylamino)-4(3H)-pyrimidinone 5'-phosphate reductase [Halorientalis regularis]|jgi:2,5-diamino-6-(ribosylamino)-4(3H)-pyrimidinone 5'-phosphate reductase|uniref:2,5-diamino-6-(ribosylamino)-4(3H)-pyrimidinone 5'-phosphate reductase n=1 Tax=Halorientalis regularis TaxID=660518 RepID=A0A1G7NVG9_9EURY|nr:2,5-diamino-6-(ribosylamino)-4(3H)-pyrimidinone 5'-phosphate reductase [Halorientalis regularis]SDF77933.1 2,5-diamino-6-(5-phosphoribosylamino)pyrimidin-4(3H)-one reductase [Halorientalis regularis]